MKWGGGLSFYRLVRESQESQVTWAGSHSLEVVAKKCPEGPGTSKPLASAF